MLNESQEKQLSKQMSYMLRHNPGEYGLVLDPEDASCPLTELSHILSEQRGWAFVSEQDVRQVVANSDKQRFEIVGDRIRARYGHSKPEIHYLVAQPPALLYHGTAESVYPLIEKEGLKPMGRQYVHLSADTHFAELAGRRKGKLLLLHIDTVRAAQQGVMFYDAGHQVWLTEHIPADCISIAK